MKKTLTFIVIGGLVLGMGSAAGGTATFVPVGPTVVAPGTDVQFEVTVQTDSIPDFDAADLVIGSSDASDLAFDYAPEWMLAFQNVTDPVSDVGFYAQDVFLGGNNPSSVGTTLLVGTVTLKTDGLGEGTYMVQVNHSIDGGVSKLSRGDLRDPLTGSATFTIQCAPIDVDCDGDLDLVDYAELPACVSGPESASGGPCGRYDGDGDGDVDLLDVQTRMTAFTGAR